MELASEANIELEEKNKGEILERSTQVLLPDDITQHEGIRLCLFLPGKYIPISENLTRLTSPPVRFTENLRKIYWLTQESAWQ
jgi:hypothetical protein